MAALCEVDAWRKRLYRRARHGKLVPESYCLGGHAAGFLLENDPFVLNDKLRVVVFADACPHTYRPGMNVHIVRLVIAKARKHGITRRPLAPLACTPMPATPRPIASTAPLAVSGRRNASAPSGTRLASVARSGRISNDTFCQLYY